MHEEQEVASGQYIAVDRRLVPRAACIRYYEYLK